MQKAQNLEAETEYKLIEKVLLVITEHIETENKGLNSTDRVLDTTHGIADSIQQDFQELIGIESDKKTFVRNLSKLFAILLNTNIEILKHKE